MLVSSVRDLPENLDSDFPHTCRPVLAELKHLLVGLLVASDCNAQHQRTPCLPHLLVLVLQKSGRKTDRPGVASLRHLQKSLCCTHHLTRRYHSAFEILLQILNEKLLPGSLHQALLIDLRAPNLFTMLQDMRQHISLQTMLGDGALVVDSRAVVYESRYRLNVHRQCQSDKRRHIVNMKLACSVPIYKRTPPIRFIKRGQVLKTIH
mmetsp:Transcript_25926/g.74363  ORF Transcript_25926/g.74363 Transcript_25926/m.74363 type:complete len:207 (-) Transcript_25926:449-1069(-)